MKTWQAVLIALVVPFGSLILIRHLWRARRWQRTYSDRLDRLRRITTTKTIRRALGRTSNAPTLVPQSDHGVIRP